MVVDRRALWTSGVLVAAIVAVIAVRSMGGSDPARPSATRPRAPAASAAAAETAPVDVNLEALARPRGGPIDRGRNPFQYQARPVPMPTFTPPPRTESSSPNGPTTMTAPPRPTGPPPPPPIPLKFIGVVTKVEQGREVRIAVLSDGKQPVSTSFYGVEGQIIDGRYQIVKIGLESIEMMYTDGRGRQSIRLTGQ